MACVRILCSYVVFALAWPWLWRHPKLQARPRERRGIYSTRIPTQHNRPCIWLHGASAGDIAALVPTIRALRQARPLDRFVVSAFTDSGVTMAEQTLGDLAEVIALPWDVPHLVARAFRHIQADVLVLEYAELWPNLLAAARRHQVSVVLHNGRLTPSLLRHYRWLFVATGNLLRSMSLLLMRDPEESQRAMALGAQPDRVLTAGNTKIDHCHTGPSEAKIASLRSGLGLQENELVWVAGSTHAGEEEHVLRAQLALGHRFAPAPVLLLAPRYVERASEVEALATSMGIQATRWSQHQGRPTAAGDVIVLDAVGLLFAAYALARVVFVGGSFVSRGGQNMLEPASLGIPVLFGPSTRNFQEAVAWLKDQGGTTVPTPDALPDALASRLSDLDAARREGQRARAAVTRHTGVARRNAVAIEALWQRAQRQIPSDASA